MSELAKPNSSSTPPAGDAGAKTGGAGGSGNAGAGVAIALPVKRGRGRPPGSGNSTAKSGGAGSASVDPAIAAVIVDTLIQLVRLGDELWQKRLLGIVNAKLPPDVRATFSENIKSAAFCARDEQILRPLLLAVVMKYSVFAKLGPEAMAVLWFGQYLVRMSALSSTLEKAAKQFAPDKAKPKAELN
jgi:hypothetical protein